MLKCFKCEGVAVAKTAYSSLNDPDYPVYYCSEHTIKSLDVPLELEDYVKDICSSSSE